MGLDWKAFPAPRALSRCALVGAAFPGFRAISSRADGFEEFDVILIESEGICRLTLLAVVAARWIVSVCGPDAASMLPDFAIDALYQPIADCASVRSII